MFAKLIVSFKGFLESLPNDQRQTFSESNPFIANVIEQPSKIIQCAMLLYVGYIEGAISFAESAGGGGSTDNDLKWGRDPDEEDRKFAFRCMQQAHRLLKPAPARTVRRGR